MGSIRIRMGFPCPDIPSEPVAHAPAQSLHGQASHLAELGALSQLYAHEVNNLLTQISARAQLALLRPQDPHLTELALLGVGDCCDRISQLTQIFLAPPSPPTPGERTNSNSSRSSIEAIHERVLSSIRDTDRAHHGFELIDTTQGYRPDLMPLLLEQILLNLLLNALRAVHEHPSASIKRHTIRVHASLIEQHTVCSTWNTPTIVHTPARMRISVEDAGVGMSASQITQLMNGLQVQSSTTNIAHPFTRHGLGIRVCRKLLDTVGGQLQCESTPLVGTRMSITVPAIRAMPVSDTQAAA